MTRPEHGREGSPAPEWRSEHRALVEAARAAIEPEIARALRVLEALVGRRLPARS